MLNSKAYWITPDNEILDIGLGTHIDMIIKYPDRFNLTKESITTTYQKYNELIGIEGKARYEIIMQLLADGFIRARLYPNQYWSISTEKWDSRTKMALAKWAEVAKEVKNAGRYMDIVITTKNQVIRDFIVEDLYCEKHILKRE